MKIVVLDGFTLNPGDNPWAPIAALGELKVFERSAPAQVASRAGGAAIVIAWLIARRAVPWAEVQAAF